MKFLSLVLLAALSFVSIDAAHAAIKPVDFVEHVVGTYVITNAKGECAPTILALPVATKDPRILLQYSNGIPLTVIRWINRGNMYENVDWKSISANRVNTSLQGKSLTMIEQQCARFSCETNLQIRVRNEGPSPKLVVQTSSVRCEYTK